MRFIVIPCQAHTIWSTCPQPGAPVCYLVPRGDALGSHAVQFSPSYDPVRIGGHIPPCWFRSGGAIPDTGGPTPTIWLLVKSVVFRLSGRNQ
jgi:hypothetical protein